MQEYSDEQLYPYYDEDQYNEELLNNPVAKPNKTIAMAVLAASAVYFLFEVIGLVIMCSSGASGGEVVREMVFFVLCTLAIIVVMSSFSGVKREKRMFFSRLFSIRGRISRMEFSLSFLAYQMTLGLAMSIHQVLYYVTIALFIIPFLAQVSKRAHDLNTKGWWIIVPIANIVYLIMFVATSGKGEVNSYGEPPLFYQYEGQSQ